MVNFASKTPSKRGEKAAKIRELLDFKPALTMDEIVTKLGVSKQHIYAVKAALKKKKLKVGKKIGRPKGKYKSRKAMAAAAKLPTAPNIEVVILDPTSTVEQARLFFIGGDIPQMLANMPLAIAHALRKAGYS